MGPDLSHVTSSGRFPRILIAENNFSTVESLIQTFGDRRLDVDYNVCTSHDCAVLKLFHSPPPYQLVISSVRLAEIDNFLLLKHNRNLQPFVPFVVTSGVSDTASSRRALEEGAFDVIHTPLEHEQTVSTISLALWHNKLKALIASRDNALERYHQHITKYPGDRSGEAFRTILASIEESLSAHRRTIDRIETSIKCLVDLAENVEEQARYHALRRLGAFPK
ncbi:MAG TPA: response regulator [Nitrospira sp.]|nr:response regulator [Nitrospira sp.]